MELLEQNHSPEIEAQLLLAFSIEKSDCNLPFGRSRFVAVDVPRRCKEYSGSILVYDIARMLPLQVLLELTLSLRNAQEVLCSLNTDISSRSALCTVYVSRETLLLIEDDRKAVDLLDNVAHIAKWILSVGCESVWQRLENILKSTVSERDYAYTIEECMLYNENELDLVNYHIY